ncbi:MAG: outer membrane beta-barrel protein [Rhodospirillales bacterium]|nr:outer membrane beta-barrel protein [Rhodospirillales bacterium]
MQASGISKICFRLLPVFMFCAALLLSSIIPATAQVSYKPANDTMRPKDDAGIRLGRFLLSPAITSRVQYDDNIFLSEDGATSDVITTVTPRLTLQGDWRVFHLHLAAGSELGFFADSTDDDYQDIDLKAAASLDLGSSSIEGAIDWNQSHDARGDNDVPSSATEPVIYRDVIGQLGGRYATNDLRYETSFAIRRLEFDDSTAIDGSTIRNDDRDRIETRETLRALLPLDLGREAYGEITFNQRQYDRVPDDTERIRDSSGFQAFGGLRLDLTDLITADLAAGWMNQSYADPAFGNINDYTLRADIDWSVTRLTGLKFSASRAVRETTVTGASGILAFDIGAGISHELRRWLQLGARAHYSDEEFRQTTRRDRTSRIGLNMAYQLNRYAQINGAINHDLRLSNSDGNDYRRFQTQISLKLEM